MNTREIMQKLLSLDDMTYCFSIVIENQALFLLEINDSRLRDTFYKIQNEVKRRFGSYDYRQFKIDLMDCLARKYLEQN
ncbi:hypothetical protein UT300012_22580 [Paraclostridium bifermentans]